MIDKLKIPREAIDSLVETCEELSREWGRPSDEIFKDFLKLMKKHSDFFFSNPWPQTMMKHAELAFADDEEKFIKAARTYREESDRFTLVCLRRNMSLEGFEKEGFLSEYRFYGRASCWACLIPDIMQLREDDKKQEEFRKELEEGMKQENPSQVTQELYEYQKRPEVVRRNKMRLVQLWLYEEESGLKGMSCTVKHMYRCPYGKRARTFVKEGWAFKTLWKIIEWYDEHWHSKPGYEPPEHMMKWYHYDEPDIIDITNIEDLNKAFDDGRIDTIINEYIKYEKETENKP